MLAGLMQLLPEGWCTQPHRCFGGDRFSVIGIRNPLAHGEPQPEKQKQ